MAGAQRAIDPTKVAIYIRWSTEDQTEGTTLDVQTDGCSHFVKSQGWIVNPNLVFIDDGYSGGNLDRPALAKMRKQILAGQIDCVVTFKIDRLSRNVVDTVNLVLREWENRCYFKSAREAIDTSDPADKISSIPWSVLWNGSGPPFVIGPFPADYAAPRRDATRAESSPMDSRWVKRARLRSYRSMLRSSIESTRSISSGPVPVALRSN